MARPRKARVEGATMPAERVSDVPAPVGLAAIVEAFQQAHSDEWEQLRLCPLEYGLQTMIERLS